MERPLWRWLLFCAANGVYGRFGWALSLRVMAWCVLPEWLGEVGCGRHADCAEAIAFNDAERGTCRPWAPSDEECPF